MLGLGLLLVVGLLVPSYTLYLHGLMVGVWGQGELCFAICPNVVVCSELIGDIRSCAVISLDQCVSCSHDVLCTEMEGLITICYTLNCVIFSV